jgi:hypothetical protein
VQGEDLRQRLSLVAEIAAQGFPVPNVLQIERRWCIGARRRQVVKLAAADEAVAGQKFLRERSLGVGFGLYLLLDR